MKPTHLPGRRLRPGLCDLAERVWGKELGSEAGLRLCLGPGQQGMEILWAVSTSKRLVLMRRNRRSAAVASQAPDCTVKAGSFGNWEQHKPLPNNLH